MSKSLTKDTIRDIKKSIGRFLSILMICALGVAFFVGIKSSPLSMEKTVDQYYDDYNMMTGIASPAPILERLEGCTKQIDLLSFDDHHNFTHRDIQLIKERFHKLKGEHRLIITTEKDATRLINHPALDKELKPFIYALPIEIEILQNQQDKFNQHIIDYVRENTRNRSLSER